MNRIFIIGLLLCSMTVSAKDYYLFTDKVKTEESTTYKEDSITWVFNPDSCSINVLTEMENLALMIADFSVMYFKDQKIISDIYVCDIGIVSIDFVLLDNGKYGDFLQVTWLIDDNFYFFK